MTSVDFPTPAQATIVTRLSSWVVTRLVCSRHLTWIVERSFAWLGRNRRLGKDYEYCVQSSETLIEIAATRLILNHLAPA